MSGKRMTLEDREIIEEMWNAGESYVDIGRAIGRSDSTIYSEIKRNSPDGLTYSAETAQRQQLQRTKGRATRGKRVGRPFAKGREHDGKY